MRRVRSSAVTSVPPHWSHCIRIASRVRVGSGRGILGRARLLPSRCFFRAARLGRSLALPLLGTVATVTGVAAELGSGSCTHEPDPNPGDSHAAGGAAPPHLGRLLGTQSESSVSSA